MSKLIQILQNSLKEYDVPVNVVNKLYNMIGRKETYHEDVINFDNSNFIGEIHLTGPTYQEYIDKINEYFRYLEIHPTSVYIKFEDSAVEQVLLNAGIGDGVGITYKDAANVKTLPSFKLNTDITSFNELKYFTKVKTIEYQTFQQCTNLVSIDLSNITRLNGYAFAWCSSLEHIVDGSNLTYIASHGFTDCTQLTDANTINFSNLTFLSYDGVFQQVPITGDIILTNNVEHDGSGWSFCKTQIRSITFGPGMGGSVGGRIMNLGWANHISSPNLIFVDMSASKVTRMYNYGFNNCNTMKLIKIPSTVTRCGNFIFTNCTALEAIVLYATTPPSYSGEEYDNMNITTPVLFNINKNGGSSEYTPPNGTVRLYVPKESLNVYKTDAVWGKYADITLSIEDDYVDPDYYTETFNNI